MHLSSSCVTAGNSLLTGKSVTMPHKHKASRVWDPITLLQHFQSVVQTSALRKEHNLTRLQSMQITSINCCLDLMAFRKIHIHKIL